MASPRKLSISPASPADTDPSAPVRWQCLVAAELGAGTVEVRAETRRLRGMYDRDWRRGMVREEEDWIRAGT
jgi:hypothetical protein